MTQGNPFARFSVGDVIAERFRLEARLGEGGVGQVWRATQLNLGRPVALKLLHPRCAENPLARARFKREAKVASALTHRNVVRIHDFGDDDGTLFLSMEYLEGTLLRDLVDTHLPPLPLPRALDIAAQIADGLAAAHALELVHRDLKPENVFLEKTSKGNDRVVIVDFGLAFIEGDEERGRMTSEGAPVGTPDYMSPEQCVASTIGPRSDVYALGCMLFEMLTSRVPFVGAINRVILQHMFEPPPSPRSLRADLAIPEELDNLCLRMLAKLPEERPEIAAVADVLDSAKDQPGRSRTRRYLQGRAARMVPAVSAPAPPDAVFNTTGRDDAPELAIFGRLDGDLLLGLGAMGLIPFVYEGGPVGRAQAIFAPGASVERLSSLRSAHAVPLITDAKPKSMDRIAALVKLGVDEVVTDTATSSEVARKVWRAIRRYRRRIGS